MGRAPRTKETLPDFLKWRRVTRHPLVFRGLTGSQRTPGFWGVTCSLSKLPDSGLYLQLLSCERTFPLASPETYCPIVGKSREKVEPLSLILPLLCFPFLMDHS